MHICKTCGESDISKFGIHSATKKPYSFCRHCRNSRYRSKQPEYYKTDKGRSVKASSEENLLKSNKVL